MVDCELRFKAGKYEIMECLQKSFLHGDIKPNPFVSKDRKEIKEYIKRLLIDNIQHERNINNPDELGVFYRIISHIRHLDATDNPIEMYCEIASR